MLSSCESVFTQFVTYLEFIDSFLEECSKRHRLSGIERSSISLVFRKMMSFDTVKKIARLSDCII